MDASGESLAKNSLQFLLSLLSEENRQKIIKEYEKSFMKQNCQPMARESESYSEKFSQCFQVVKRLNYVVN